MRRMLSIACTGALAFVASVATGATEVEEWILPDGMIWYMPEHSCDLVQVDNPPKLKQCHYGTDLPETDDEYLHRDRASGIAYFRICSFFTEERTNEFEQGEANGLGGQIEYHIWGVREKNPFLVVDYEVGEIRFDYDGDGVYEEVSTFSENEAFNYDLGFYFALVNSASERLPCYLVKAEET
jgi:hypothetical protein